MTCFHDPHLVLDASRAIGSAADPTPGASGPAGAPPALAQPCASCPARRASICAEIPNDALSRLARRLTQTTLPAGAPLPAEGEAPFLGVLASGWLRWVHFGRDGRRRVLGLVQPGEMIWRPAEPIGALETATAAQVCRFDDPALVHPPHAATAAHPGEAEGDPLDRLRLAQARRELDRLHALAIGLAMQTPEQRLAGFLAAGIDTMAWRPFGGSGGGGVLAVPLSRPDIADLLGTTVESVSRITRRFHAEGLIRILDPRRFEIPDAAALARLAGAGATRGAAKSPTPATPRLPPAP